MTGPKFGTVKSFYKNQIIFKEGHTGNVGYLIKSGQVEIYKIIEHQKKILNRLGPGEVFGEIGIITESPRSAHAEATEFSELVIIDKDSLLNMLKQSPKMIQAITMFLMKRLSSTLHMLDEKDEEEKKDDTSDSKAMISIISLLDLMAGQTNEIDYHTFCIRAADIAGFNQTEINTYIQRLSDLKTIKIAGELKNGQTSDCTIKVHDSKALLNSIKRDLARKAAPDIKRAFKILCQ